MGINSSRENKIVHFGSQTIDVNQTRFISKSTLPLTTNHRPKFTVPLFTRLSRWEIALEEIPVQKGEGTVLKSGVYFRNKEDSDIYAGALFGLKQLSRISVFEDFDMREGKNYWGIVTSQTLPSVHKLLNKKELQQNVQKFIDLLIFLADLLAVTQKLYVTPEEIVQCNSIFYLKSFHHSSQVGSLNLIQGFINWLYSGDQQEFQECLKEQTIMNSINDPNCFLKEIYQSLTLDAVSQSDLGIYLRRCKAKSSYLGNVFDSYHSCFKAKKNKYRVNSEKQWLLAKHDNQIYFINVQDEHVCHARIIRKRRKINVDNVNLLFNPDQFQISFYLQGTKNIVKTTQFELGDSFTISDIAIKHKFPFKLRSPILFAKGKDIYIYDQMVMRYSTDQNKLHQLSKKLSDCICFVSSHELNYLAVRLSFDIFRLGIQIYIGEEFQTLVPSGNQALKESIANIKIDIKHVQFCIQVFKGVFLMLANKNLWILDINFKCFFSYAPIDRVREHSKGRTNDSRHDFMFDIINQPFKATWLPRHAGINVSIKNNIMHVVGQVMGKYVLLQYRIIFEAGILSLVKARPIYENQRDKIIEEHTEKFTQHKFNLYNEHFDIYKNSTWIYSGPHFLSVRNLSLAQEKSHYAVTIESESTITSLKDVIQCNKQLGRRWKMFQKVMILYRLFSIYTELYRQNCTHKNFNLGNLWITKARDIKLSGWSEPQRNWQISDYKDFLMLCFNVICEQTYDKCSDKLLAKHKAELAQFPPFSQKILGGLSVKVAQKRQQLQKNIVQLREYLNRQIHRFVTTSQHNNFLFSFEHNTPRFTMLNIRETKIKKFNAVVEGLTQEFTFKHTDRYVWHEETSLLFVFTNQYQMYQIKIVANDYKQETIQLQEYQYLPKNIIDCSFIITPVGLLAVGGVARNSKSKVNYNTKIYHFNRQKLTWQQVAELDQPRINPKLILSETGNYVYIFGGQLDIQVEKLQLVLFNVNTHQVQCLVDLGISNPLRALTGKKAYKLFQLCEQYNIFMLWSTTNTLFSIKLFSTMICGFEIDLEGKIYMQEGSQIPLVSISFVDGNIHFLKAYGKYTKICLDNLQSPSVTHKTLYSNEK